MESNPVVLIRTDANDSIASGHMMRCLTIASQLCRLKAQIVFAFSDEESRDYFLRLRSFTAQELPSDDSISSIILNSDYRNPELELSLIKNELICRNVSLILVDSYFVTSLYLQSLREICTTVYIDDIYSFDYPVDYLINYDLYPDSSFYSLAKYKLLGASYTPLRSQFQNIKCQIKDIPTDILLSTGGSDPYKISYHFLKYIFEDVSPSPLKELHYHILLQNNNDAFHEVVELSKHYSCIQIHEQVSNMAGLMQQCDIAITAGGTTLYELCAVSVPTICYSMADNQIIPASDFEKAGCCIYTGDCRNNAHFFNQLYYNLDALYQNHDKRKALHDNMKRLIDGQGAARIAKQLLNQ